MRCPRAKSKRTNQANQQKLSELFEGLRIYFDAALPVMLLYRYVSSST